MAVDSSMQRISRLTPLDTVLALIEARVGPVQPRRCAAASARGLALAEGLVAPGLPEAPLALRDGFAVDAAAVAAAGPYMPVPLTLPARRIDAGDRLPPGTDAVLPFDAVTLRG